MDEDGEMGDGGRGGISYLWICNLTAKRLEPAVSSKFVSRFNKGIRACKRGGAKGGPAARYSGLGTRRDIILVKRVLLHNEFWREA